MNSLLLNTAAEQMANVSATGLAEYAWLMVAIPLLVSGFLLVCGRATDKWGHWLAVAASWSSFLLGFIIFCQMIGQAPAERSILAPVFTWFKAGSGNEAVELSWNQLTSTLWPIWNTIRIGGVSSPT